jgi:hypothetical protein
MPITATCPDCAKSIEVKDEHAGKKFRCKQCGGVVTVPDVTAATGGDEWNDLDAAAEIGELPPRLDEQQRRRRANRDDDESPGGMPAVVIVAIVLESLLILLNIVGIFGNLASQNVGGACGSMLRILIEAGAITGYALANNAIRWISVILSGVGIALLIACGGFFMLMGESLPPAVRAQFPQEMIIVLLVILAVQILMMAAIIACLVVPSARDYFEG